MLLILLNVFGLIFVLLGLYVVCVNKNLCTGFLFMGVGNVMLLIMSLINGNSFNFVLHSIITIICCFWSYNCYKDEKKIGK